MIDHLKLIEVGIFEINNTIADINNLEVVVRDFINVNKGTDLLLLPIIFSKRVDILKSIDTNICMKLPIVRLKAIQKL